MQYATLYTISKDHLINVVCCCSVLFDMSDDMLMTETNIHKPLTFPPDWKGITEGLARLRVSTMWAATSVHVWF